MLTIDGAQGEGGGQVLRTSLALSLVTGTPCRIVNVRAGRKKPGLLPQHLTAVRAASEVGRAVVRGAEIASRDVSFEPERIVPGEYRFVVGTAGSATLVLQTVLPALLTASGPSRLELEGGTHNMQAPPYDFLEKTFLPLVNRMGPRVESRLERPGFYPAGGGRFVVSIEPTPHLSGLDLLDRGSLRRRRATAIVSKLPTSIAKRELAVIGSKLGWPPECLRTEEVANPRGPGNVLVVEIESENVTEVIVGFGRIGLRAETVANGVARAVDRYLRADVPVGEHLADQLLIPLALAGRGSFRTLAPTPHTETNIGVIRQFLDVPMAIRQAGDGAWLFEAGGP